MIIELEFCCGYFRTKDQGYVGWQVGRVGGGRNEAHYKAGYLAIATKVLHSSPKWRWMGVIMAMADHY